MAKDWMNAYGAGVKKFQEGGQMAAPEEEMQMAEGGEAGGAPDIEGMVAEYAQTRDPELAIAIADTLVEMMGAMQAEAGGGGEMPEEGAPMARNGMKLNRGPVFKK